jgi:hypothetical protein
MTAASRLSRTARGILATGLVRHLGRPRASRRRCIWPSRGCSFRINDETAFGSGREVTR